MRKAIQLTVQFEVIGAPPPTGGMSLAAQDVRDVLSAGHWRHPRLQVSVMNIALAQPIGADDTEHLVARVWIEGEDAPADDFAKLAEQALQTIVAAGSWRHPQTTVAITGIAEADDADDNEE